MKRSEQFELTEQCYHRYSEWNIDLNKYTRLVERKILQNVSQIVIETYHSSHTTNEQRELFDSILDAIRKFRLEIENE